MNGPIASSPSATAALRAGVDPRKGEPMFEYLMWAGAGVLAFFLLWLPFRRAQMRHSSSSAGEAYASQAPGRQEEGEDHS